VGSVVGATIAADGVVWTMSDWVAEWVTNPNPSTPGTVMTIEFRDGSTMIHTVVEDETVHHDAVGVWLQTVTGAGRERVVEHRTFVWHDVSYLRLQLVQELKIRSPDPSMQGLNTTWHVDQRPNGLAVLELGRSPDGRRHGHGRRTHRRGAWVARRPAARGRGAREGRVRPVIGPLTGWGAATASR
jgi:hypothetical protein